MFVHVTDINQIWITLSRMFVNITLTGKTTTDKRDEHFTNAGYILINVILFISHISMLIWKIYSIFKTVWFQVCVFPIHGQISLPGI
jgi:hypothetical protein